MPNYLFQGTKDSQGQEGPTRQKMADRHSFNQSKARALESLFEVAAPLATYSGEAQGAINPLSMLQRGYLDKALAKGATEKQLFKDHGLVRSGDRSWGKFEEDLINPSFRGKFTAPDRYGLVKPIQPEEMRLSDIFSSPLIGGGNAKVSLQSMDNSLVGGLDIAGVKNGVYRPDNTIKVNSNKLRRPDEFDGTLQHEYQHLIDYLRKQSSGTNVGEAGSTQRYFHNIGEVRARQNDFLNNSPEIYNGLESVFDNIGQKFNPQMLYGE